MVPATPKICKKSLLSVPSVLSTISLALKTQICPKILASGRTALSAPLEREDMSLRTLITAVPGSAIMAQAFANAPHLQVAVLQENRLNLIS